MSTDKEGVAPFERKAQKKLIQGYKMIKVGLQMIDEAVLEQVKSVRRTDVQKRTP